MEETPRNSQLNCEHRKNSHSEFVHEKVKYCQQNHIPKLLCLKKLNSWIKDIPVEDLSLEWEKNIKHSVLQLFKRKHDRFFKFLIDEIRQTYINEMQNFVLRTILASESNKKEINTFLPERREILFENCKTFSKHRKSLSKRYFLSHSLVRFIMKTAFFKLPRLFIDLNHYRPLTVLTLAEFDIKIKEDIKRASLHILSHFYNLIIKSFPKLNILKNINSYENHRVIHCASVLFAQQILNIKMNTITHLINAVQDSLACPLLKFDLIFENNQLNLSPSIKEICFTYHEIIDNISNIAHGLVPFESWLAIKSDQDFINIKLPEWFLQESHNNLEEVLKNIFQSLNEYYLNVNQKFKLICEPEAEENVLQLISEEREFEEYCSQVKMFMNYLSEVNAMVSKLYNDTGVLDQSLAKEILKSRTLDLINILVNYLKKSHEKEARWICSQFETLETRALNIPKDPKSLFELSEYMSRRARDLVSNLEKRVLRLTQTLGSLLEITILSPEHIHLNRQSINWIEVIKPIFTQSNTLSEAMKSESEDELQKRITILNSEIDELVPEFIILNDMDDVKRIPDYLEYLKALVRKMNRVEKQIRQINFEERLFKFPETTFPKDTELKEVFEPFYTLVLLICEWKKSNEIWLEGPFEYLDAEVIERKTKYFFEEISESNKTFKSKIKIDLTSNKAYKFSGIVDDPDPMQQPAPLKLCWQALQDINNFMNFVPLVICFCNPALRKRHWDEMSAVSGQDLFPNAGTTLKKIIELDLMRHIDMFQVISTGANKELALQYQLKGMFQEWESINFQVSQSDEIYTFTESEKIEILLEDHFMKIQIIRGSYFVGPIEPSVLELLQNLTQIQVFIQQWYCLQFAIRKYVSLFSNARAANQLPEEEVLFLCIKQTLNKIKESIFSNPTFKYVAKNSKLITNLEESHSKMKIIEESVQFYLETRRLEFPRFFFISDNEMFDILFERKDPSTLGLSLVKCFPGVKKFGITKSFKITSINGNFGEKVIFLNPVVMNHKLEESETGWLINVEDEIHRTLMEKIFEAYSNFDIESCIIKYPGMVSICSWQLYWTTQIQSRFQPIDIERFKSFEIQEQQLISLELNQLKSDLPRLSREILSALITLQVYHKELTGLLISKNVKSENDFEWIAQLRYYLQDKRVQVNLMNASINYGYEYNNHFSIINTPLTERCYRTLMEAYCYNYFGSMIGPSGTGKTEIVRSLAKAFALPFQVYNGNNEISVNFVEQILKGLVSCGAWICFKNFDQIEEGILSVISQRIVSISESRETGVIDFDGALLKLKKSSFISITMNSESTDKFYCLQKCSLPETIKFQFRTITIISPDINRICEIELFAAGFIKAKVLALKINTIYTLCTELLKECNFEMRSVKLILKTAICLKEKFPDEEENVLIFRALIDLNMPKLNRIQISIFKGIIEDTFPGVSLPNPDYVKFLEEFEDVCKRNCLSVNAEFKLKIIQIFEMIHVRDGIVIIGQPFSGKTTILKTLAEVLSIVNDKVELEYINPGSVTINQLYGYFDEKYKKWKDGIFLKILRFFLNFSKGEAFSKKWVIFDGLIHTWTENLHSLLDNNKKLILNSHEKILKPQEMIIFIETLDLRHTSPLIISRFGIVNLESGNWRNYIKPLIKKLEINNFEHHKTLIYSLFDWTIDSSLQFIYKNCKMIVKVNRIHLVVSTFNLFSILLEEALKQNSIEKGKQDYLMTWVQAIFVISSVWALAGTLEFDSLKLFNAFYLSFWTNLTETRPDFLKHNEISLPSEGLLRDYIYIFKGNGTWKHSNDFLKTENILENSCFKEIFIPTVDSIKYSNILQNYITHKKPFLLCSTNSTGKTSLLQNLFSTKLPEIFSVNLFNFTSNVTATKAQRLFLSKLLKRKPEHYGPLKKFSINFVDDLNCENVSNIHTDSVLELMRQLLDYGFWYESEKQEKIFIHDTMFVITMNEINPNMDKRFLRHFNIYSMHDPCKESIFRIFSNLLFLNLKKNTFAMDVMPSLHGIVNATVEFYFSIKESLRPIPGKLQYIFNLRDISKVIRGCSIIQKESVESKITFIRLWVHETYRVFGDRIIDCKDKNWFFSKLKLCVKSYFKDSFHSIFDHLPKIKHEELTQESFKFLNFGNFIDDKSVEKSCDLRKYEEINSMETLQNKVNSYINEHNNEHKIKLNISISNFILEHLLRICRIMAIPGENLLMVCSCGFGRKSLIRLAAYIEKQNLFEPALDSYYNLKAWRKDLKSLLKKCGCGNEDYTISVTDRDLKEEFLIDVINLVKTSRLPELFSSDDEREIVKNIRLTAQNGNRNLELSIPEILNYFTKECKQKLHFIICVSPLQISKQGNYIPLIKFCTLSYLTSWPKETFEKVGITFLQDINIKEEIKSEILTSARYFHSYAEDKIPADLGFEISPSIFVRLIKLYSRTMSKKQKELQIARSKYMAGLEKLKLAANQVDQMKKVIMTLRPQLESSAQQTRATMEEIENENLAIEKATIIVKDEEKVANEKADIAGKLRAECETDLAVAIPILEDAISALNTLKPTDITLVKAMKNPPDTVKLVMAAVCVMLEVPSERLLDPVTGKKSTDFWGPSKRVLGDMNFLQNLKDYDKDNIPSSIMQIIKSTYMTDKSFLPHIVAKASSAAEGLCKWVRAMVSYDEVAKAVAPKKEKLVLAQRECDEAEAYLTEKRETLADLNERLAALKTSLEIVLTKKLELEKEVTNCTDRLEKAESLLTSLGGEKSRWIRCTDNLQESFNFLAGDVLLACGLIIYLASYKLKERNTIIQKWKEFIRDHRIPSSEEFHFVKILESENKFYSWYLSGLSKTPFLLQNAVIMDNSDNWCLFIDPENEAKQWIQNLEKDNNLKTIKFSDKDCLDVVQNSIKFGNPVLIENFEGLIASLDPVLLQIIYSESDQMYLEIRQKKILYSPDFRFYITTREKNPKLSTDIFHRVTLVNFSFPEEALSEKLLDIVISKENYQLQDKFDKLLTQLSEDKMALNNEEDKVLEILSASNVNILEDKKAMQILDSSKNLTLEIIKRRNASIIMKKEIDLFRENYRNFAKYSARLVSIVDSLLNINRMYKFSLSWFYMLYIRAIESSKRSVILEKRLNFLKFKVTRKLHTSIKNCLMEKDKLLYSFLLSVKILQYEGKISEKEIQVFCNLKNKFKNSSDELISDKWEPEKIEREISKINEYMGKCFTKNLINWEIYFKDPRNSIPDHKNLTTFQNLIIANIIRPDQIRISVSKFVETVLECFESNDKFQSQCNISMAFEESTCLTPLIFILPSHVTLLPIVSNFAKRMRFSSKLIYLSMNEAQGQKAEFLIKEAQKDEKWIFLENCHLAPLWMPRLERIVESFNASNTSLEFRLWLSSFSNQKFPTSVLQGGIKISCDSPVGLKENLLWTYNSKPINEKQFFDGCPGKDKAFLKLLYGLSFFHAIIKERRNYGHRGWNLNYDFNESDFSLIAVQLQHLINKNEEVPFEALLYLIKECSYGSKISSKIDKQRLDVLIEDFCNLEMVRDPFYKFLNEPEFVMPRRNEYNGYINQILKIRNVCRPEVFRLDENCEIIKNLRGAKNFVDLFNSVGATKFEDESKEEKVRGVISQIREKLGNVFVVEEIRNKYQICYEEPLHEILILEIEICNSIFTVIETSFRYIENAYNGLTLWDTVCNQLSKNLVSNIIPNSWKIRFNITQSTLSSFLDNLSKKYVFLNNWIKKGNPKTYYLEVFNYSKALLIALRMQFARNYNFSFTEINLCFKIPLKYNVSETSDCDSFQIRSLFLAGGQWNVDKKILISSSSKAFWYEIPVIIVKFYFGDVISAENAYECPLYNVPFQNNFRNFMQEEDNFILTVSLPSERNDKYWIKRGTALYCRKE